MSYMKHLIPFRAWPRKMLALYECTKPLRYCDRFLLTLFLFGNGVHRRDILRVMDARVAKKRHRQHVRGLLDAFGNPDCKYSYYDVRSNAILYIATRRSNLAYSNVVQAWEDHVSHALRSGRSEPSYRDQLNFFAAWHGDVVTPE